MKYGGGMPSKGINNNSGGNSQGKGGKMRAPIDRGMGMSMTLSAVQSKTRSQAKGSNKHYHYEGCSGYGDNENILGYSPE